MFIVMDTDSCNPVERCHDVSVVSVGREHHRRVENPFERECHVSEDLTESTLEHTHALHH